MKQKLDSIFKNCLMAIVSLSLYIAFQFHIEDNIWIILLRDDIISLHKI